MFIVMRQVFENAYKALISGAGLSAKMGIARPVLSAATATSRTAPGE